MKRHLCIGSSASICPSDISESARKRQRILFVIPRRRTVTKMSNLRRALGEAIAEQSQRPRCCLLLSVAADRRRNCIDKLPLKRSRTQPGVKITFSLMTNLKLGTLDMQKHSKEVCALSRPGTVGGLSFWLICVSYTQLARPCSCSCCRYFGQFQHGPMQSQISLHRSALGRRWWLHPKSAADPGYPGTDS